MPDKVTQNSFTLLPGQASPFGASLSDDGCNFSIYSPDASAVYLCLFDDADNEIAQIELAERVQSTWFGRVESVKEGQKYAYRVFSKSHRKVNSEMDVGRLLIDPYAKQLSHQLNWDKAAYIGKSDEVLGKQVKNNAKFIPKSIVTALFSSPSQTPDKQLTANFETGREPANRIIYEAHVKGLTQLHPDVPEHHRGTYLGACHPSVLQHLKDLGVTAVQFLPVFAFMPEPFVSEKGLTNYWGYNPINFFSPEPRYAIDNALDECKTMVNAYHQAGFEVILDVVFNHTAESGDGGSILSFKGFCHKHAYLQVENDELNEATYINYSGCGNTVNSSGAYMMTLIIDSLRYWTKEIGIDGFRFDLAACLGRQPLDFHGDAAIFKILRQDPLLKNVLMIAEPWDIGPGGYQLGQFPDYWLEVNDKFRDTVRGFWRSDTGLKAGFATRFMGSRDVFLKGIRPMHASVNHVTYHDGFTLHDLVSYSQKHNLPNLEDNNDGHNHNLSHNFGVEGETNQTHINEEREKQKRNLFATLILSQGTPHILGGDELSRTQKGNNNAYCQDNEISWFNWELDPKQQAFLTFTKYLIALRKNNPLLREMMFADEQFNNKVNIASANWYRIDGMFKRDQDWTNDNHHCYVLHIVGRAEDSAQEPAEEWQYVVNSSNENVEFNLPLLDSKTKWQCVLNTSISEMSEYASELISSVYLMQSRSFCLFKKIH